MNLPTTGWGMSQQMVIAAEDLEHVSIEVGLNGAISAVNPMEAPSSGETCPNSTTSSASPTQRPSIADWRWSGRGPFLVPMWGRQRPEPATLFFSGLVVIMSVQLAQRRWDVDHPCAGRHQRRHVRQAQLEPLSGEQIEGMDESACNYDPTVMATVDDGSCRYDETCGECDGGVAPNRCDCGARRGCSMTLPMRPTSP